MLNEIHRDLIEMVVIRTCALLTESQRSTDATLLGAADLLDVPEIGVEIVERSKAWTYPNDVVADTRRGWLRRDQGRFTGIVRGLDLDNLRSYRHWVLAHTTLNPTPPLTFIQIWETAEATLLAYDLLCRVVTGQDEDTLGLAKARREQSTFFWETFRPLPAREP